MQVNLGNIKGATGQTGATGATGANGADGLTPYIRNGNWWIGTEDLNVTAKGNEWLYGTTIPTSEGNNGDLYLKTDTSDVYKKTSGVWGLIANIKGQQGIQGIQGENATSLEMGTITTLESEDDATAELISLGNGAYQLNLGIPKGEQGEQGEQGQNGNTSVYVNGFVVNSVNFSSDPQTQIDNLSLNKLNTNQGVENAGKFLQVGVDGSVHPVSSDAEDDVIDGYYYNGEFYEDSEHAQVLIGASGKIYIDVVNNLQYRYNGSGYVLLTTDISGKADKTDAVGSIELSLNSSTYVLTLQAKNVNGQNVGTAQTIDLPLESIISSATYYDSYTYSGTTYTQVIVITLSTTSVPTIVPVGALISGLQNEITSSNKLSADLVADGTTNKVYTATEQTKLSSIESGAQVNTITGIKGNAESSYRTGNVEIAPDDLDDTNTTNKFVSSTEKSTWNGKQDALTFDTAPTQNSTNPVQSGGIYTALNNLTKIFTNTSVSTWTTDNTYTDYGYKASITLTGVTADMIPQVIFGATEAVSGNYLPIAESYSGGIYIYSKVNTAITIPTILIIKAGI